MVNMPKLASNETIIERVSHAKVLGVTLSANLCWNMHVENIVRKASKRFACICYTKLKELDRKGRPLEDNLSVIRPVLEYMHVQYGIHIYQDTCAIVLNGSKSGPYEVFTR